MEWILIALVVYWVYRTGAKSQARKAERAARQREQAAAEHLVFAPGVLMAMVDGYAYWMSRGTLVRAPCANGNADIARAEPADPLTCVDLPPGLALEILEALQQAEQSTYWPD